MTASIAVIVGLIIGWNLPQPSWAKSIQDKIVNKIIDKFEGK